MIETLVGIGVIATTITGLAIWQLRITANDLKSHLNTHVEQMRSEFKELNKDIDRKLDGINIYVDRKVEGVKTYVRDIDLKTNTLQEKIHRSEVDHLNFKSNLPNEFATRREMDEVKKRIVRLEGPVLDSNHN